MLNSWFYEVSFPAYPISLSSIVSVTAVSTLSCRPCMYIRPVLSTAHRLVTLDAENTDAVSSEYPVPEK